MRRSRAMTLIEVLFVIAVIATLAAILFPVFARARECARKHSCLSNLVNIGLALQMYAEDHAGRFPPIEDDLSPLVPRYLREWRVFICPSSNREDLPMGAPANPKLYKPPPAGGPPGGTTPPSPKQPKRELTINYYYRAGHRLYEAPSPILLSDQSPIHLDHANVIYADGHAATPDTNAWRALGFKPVEDLWPPGPHRPPPSPLGMPGAGGRPGGGPPGMPGGGPKP